MYLSKFGKDILSNLNIAPGLGYDPHSDWSRKKKWQKREQVQNWWGIWGPPYAAIDPLHRIRPLQRMQEMAFLVFNESGSPQDIHLSRVLNFSLLSSSKQYMEGP